MKPLRAFPELLLAPLKTLLSGERTSADPADAGRGKGQSLLRLHEYQHRVIVEMFKITQAGFMIFSIVLLGLSLYVLLNPDAPAWMAVLLIPLAVVLVVALHRTVKELKTYRNNYAELTALLRAKLLQQARVLAAAQDAMGKTPVEHRLLSALKPKEHGGWDCKHCKNCQKAIELLATTCQHCGHEQEALLVN